MGKYGMGIDSAPSAGSYATDRFEPIGSGSSGGYERPQGYQPRGAPEAFRIDDLYNQIAPTAGEALTKVFQAPGYVYERPLAFADSLVQGVTGSSPIDDIVEGVRGIPGIGPLASGAGDLTMGIADATFKAVGGVVNSGLAWGADQIKGKADNEPMPLLNEFLMSLSNVGGGIGSFLDPTDEPMTVGEFKEYLNDRGWTNDDLNALHRGQKGYLDFGEKTVASAYLPKETYGLQDFATRMALDPMNLVFMPGKVANVIGKSMTGIGRMMAVERSATKLAAPFMRYSAKGTAEGLRALAETGDVAGVTTSAMGAFFKRLAGVGSKGVLTPLATYRGVAMGTTGVQVAINTLDELTDDETVRSTLPFLQELFEFGRTMGDNKPLSENQLFMFASLLNFPVRKYTGGSYHYLQAKRAEKWKSPLAIDVVKKLAPGQSYKAGRAYVEQRLAESGIAESFDKLMWQSIRYAYHEKLRLMGVGDDSIKYTATNLMGHGMEMADYNRRLERIIGQAVKKGEVSSRDVQRGIELMVQERGGVMGEVAGGLTAQFDPEILFRTWSEFAPRAEALSNMFPKGSPIAPGIPRDVIINERIEEMLRSIDDVAENGAIDARHLYDITSTAPAIFTTPETANIARVMTRDGLKGRLDVAEVKKALGEVREKYGIAQAEYTAPFESWQSRGVAQEVRARGLNKMLREDGTLDPMYSPEVGRAEVAIQTSGQKRFMQSGLGHVTSYTQNLLRLRANTEHVEKVLPRALQDAGVPVKSATQGALLGVPGTRAGTTFSNAAEIIRLADGVDVQTAVRSAAWALRHVEGGVAKGVRRAMVILRGDDLIKTKNVVPNAEEYTFHIGSVDPDKWEDIMGFFARFGDRAVVEDTVGFVRVIVPDGTLKGNIERSIKEATDTFKTSMEKVHVIDVVDAKKLRKTDPIGAVLVKDIWNDVAKDGRFIRATGYAEQHGRVLTEIEAAQRRATGGGTRPAYEQGRKHVTRYERANGRPVRAVDTEYLVADPAVRDEWGAIIRADGGRGEGFTLRDGDELYVTPGGRNGAVVRRDGELVIIRRRDPAGNVSGWDVDGERLDEFIAAVSEHATWARADYIAGSDALIQHLGDHGWGVSNISPSLTEGGPMTVWLLRDPAYNVSKEIPKYGGMRAVLDRGIESVPYHRGKAQTPARADMLYGDRSARAQQAKAENTLLGQYRRRDELEVEMRTFRENLEGEAQAPAPRGGGGCRRSAHRHQAARPEWSHQRPAHQGRGSHLAVRPARTDVLYHVTTDLPAVQASGHLRPAGSGGLGGDDADRIVSMTVDEATANQLAADLKLEAAAEKAGSQQALDDLLRAEARNQGFEWDPAIAGTGKNPHDVMVSWFNRRDTATGVHNPVIFGRPGLTIDPTKVGVVKVPKSSLDNGALLVNFDLSNPVGLREIRSYGAVQLQRNARKSKNPNSYKQYRTWRQEYEDLDAILTKKKAREFHDQVLKRDVNPGVVRYVQDTEAELSVFKPFMDPSLEAHMDDFSQAEAAGLEALERENRLHDPSYTLKVVPRHATPYYAEQGAAYRGLVQGRELAADSWRYNITDHLQQGLGLIFDPVFAKDQARNMRQEVFNLYVNRGATVGEVNQFLRALGAQLELMPAPAGARVYRNIAALPGSVIDGIAKGEGQVAHFGGFKNQALRNASHSDLIRAASSRNFRTLSKRYPAEPGKGNLGGLIESWYGKTGAGTKTHAVGAVTRQGTYVVALGYHVLRFLLDPRWYLMNAFESDILAGARYGTKAMGHRPLSMNQTLRRTMRLKHGEPSVFAEDPIVQKLGRKSSHPEASMLTVDEIVNADYVASGWLDPRNLYGYVVKSTQMETQRVTTDVLTELMETGRFRNILDEAIDGSEVIKDLRRMFGEDPTKWVDDISDQLYRLDTVGPQHLLQTQLAQQMQAAGGVQGAAYREFLEALQTQHRKAYQDVAHMFHGNVNRSNIERVFNSPLLYWPLSYQLKAGKWLIDTMTKSFAGSRNAMTGSGVLAKLLANHSWSMDNNEEYRAMFEEHPALWRTLGMFLPMTPFDVGVMASRWSRYAGSWVGAQLGLWDQDESYPTDAVNLVQRSLSFGPAYSWGILTDILDEFNEE